ncbi:MAG: NADH-quinone oxidoreductase subunit J [Phycisphaerae bacterium]
MTAATTYWLYFVFALGGIGIYLMLPRMRDAKTRPGVLFCLVALAGLAVVLATSLADGITGYFYLFAAVALMAATRVITHPVPVYSALYFVLVVVAVSALLVLQGAEFTAIALIIVYAGAILVTYLFVIMLAQHEGAPIYDRRAREPFAAVLGGFVLMAAVAGRSGDLPAQPDRVAIPVAGSVVAADDHLGMREELGNTLALGNMVMTRYAVALELGAVLLLVSMVGAIAMSRKRVPREGVVPARRPLGEIGKEVGPY